ncbi:MULTISPECIES: Ppx/GppA phosphatase family protein [unclassified Herbaspirillum]|uniref:Ppx/GppA phosphatase family protein n=1 Tax=unclassified Herbaspirillum TaxID=2624150 RepID=UPI001153F5A3|nr:MULTISPECIES: Ppx/GppA phosphatase family protein [unclassified Herbaspirillum]MBB5390778.1 exopolyphosphatase/guanosine-5'-triphosphate,3'-diphosphate pyrophosphatase [Herbaspirillum sp. SJZ102]TQK04064.1 exopolyphosphatase/guanosine-5'-triphosphate,3'-diphosphate pyrophosphatase [Herbaspirillum sp. SJZ106]TQK14654.1 exopolyphosphatase/guanosine-5'-triphosphate,3'-diphosphate pyrophosphatase [Herbaspirillum sp. SJZ130]TWC64102.1 exopolyphosphatase/guanosine-5'-triphosphate,3'-diphosphate py
MFAAVDLGSNSFRLHIGKYENEGIRVIKSARDPIRLAAGIDKNGYLTEQACKSALDSLTRFRAILRDYSLDAVRVVATNTLRVARNAHELLPELERAIGYPVEIISGEEEGRLIYMGVAGVLAEPNEERMVIDIGGGSTEVVRGLGGHIRHVESFGIGTVNQSLAFFPDGAITAVAFERAILSARSYVEDAVHLFSFDGGVNIYGSSGTIRAIADTIARNGMGDGRVTLPGLEDLMQRLIDFGHVSQIELDGMKPDRAGVIMGGLAVLIGFMQEFGIEVVTPVEAGLRMGVMWDLQLRATKADRRDMSVDDFCRRFHVDAARAHGVADTAQGFFQLLKPATDSYARYLHWSALLHEAGLVVSPTGYHKHSSYLIANADLPGFTTREQRLMSTLILGQKGNLKKISEMLADVDFAKSVLALRLAVMFRHSHITLDLDKVKVKFKSKIELEIRRDYVKEHPSISFWIQKEQEWWAGIGVDFALKVLA